MIEDETISKISKRAVILSVMNNLCTTKSENISPHFFVDIYNKDFNQTSFMLTSIRTTLGTFWEVIAEEFAKRNGYEVLNAKSFKPSKKLLEEAEDEMQKLTDQRLEGKESPILDYCKKLDKIYKHKPIDDATVNWAGGEGVDLYLKKEDNYWIFDVKTVQVNASNGIKYDRQLIKWLTHKKNQLGNTVSAKKINVGYIFPYNSKAGGDRTSHEEWMEDQGSKAKPMTDKEIYAGNKFWSFITENPNALSKIFEGIENALGDGSIVGKHLDKYFVSGVMAPEELDRLAKEATIDFARYLFDVSFDSEDENSTYWTHENGEHKCTFPRSINTIWKNADGADGRTGLDRNLKGFTKCPKCKNKIKLSDFE